MHIFAYMALLLAMLVSLAAAALARQQTHHAAARSSPWFPRAQFQSTGLLTLASAVLFIALARADFSFLYVAEYTDSTLPMFYKITAFWAGQAGSLLFWAWTAAIIGAVYVATPGYRLLPENVKTWYWLFYMTVMAFFLLLLTCWSNPFTEIIPPPADGNGLNPLLQNPGMIFHPPLLFLGYAGYVIPGALALAWAAVGDPDFRPSWIESTRNLSLLSWTFLTAGILLGGWWSYMELGWGGYWAWDPVENASLIPWLTATAFLHSSAVERRRGALHRSNLFLMALTLLSCFFGTYLVRSGVVDSLHAFGGAGVGTPLLIFILAGLFLSVFATLALGRRGIREMSGLVSREGFLTLAIWLFLALGGIILAGSLWPVFSKFWSDSPVGLGPAFYNRVCLPIFVLLALFLAVCPWLGWKGGLKKLKLFLGAAGVFVAAAAFLPVLGYGRPLPLVGFAAAAAGCAGIVLLFAADPGLRGLRSNWGAYGVHLGLALVVMGVALSGPYKLEEEASLTPGESLELGAYTITYAELREGSTENMAFLEAELRVTRDGQEIGRLLPQRRLYRNFQQPFAEASTIPSLGEELYATLLSADDEDKADFKLSVHPLVNWIWIGGTLMCLFPFLALRKLGRR